MEVAWYLCPPAFPAAASFSAMGRASPQFDRDAVFKLFIKATGRRSRGCARHWPTWLWRASLAHWFRFPRVRSRNFRGRRSALAKLEGFELHPVSFRKIRGDAAELVVFPCGKGTPGAGFRPASPGAGKQIRGNCGPDIVPFRRMLEHSNCTPERGFSQ